MTEQYKKELLVMNYLENLGVHPISVAKAVSDSNYRKSLELISKNPNIKKEEFLKEMKIKNLSKIPQK